ncbi:MAG: hypothetical protein C0424_11845 [Sphingobacteriaceae bacterium]|nr:hypothetical protein [Sphingobacteriaceae bacterium]
MKQILLIAYFSCLGLLAGAQAPQGVIDSLLRVTRAAPHDTQKAEAYIYLVAHHRYQRDLGLKYAREGIALAKKGQFLRGLYNLYNQMGVVYDVNGDYLPALGAYREGMKAAQKMQRSDLVGSIYTNMGLSYWNLGIYDEALANYLMALKQFEGNEKTLGYLANTYNNIGLIYGDKKEYHKAKPYFEKSIAISSSLKDSFNLAACYNNMGNALRDAGESQAAIDWFQQAYSIHQALGSDYGKGMALYNLAGVYQGLEQWGLALEAAQNSLRFREIAGDRMGIALAHNLLAVNYESLRQIREALYHSDIAIQLADSLKSNSLYHRVYRNRWWVLRAAGKPAEALEAHILYKQYSDSLNMEASDKRLRELEVRFEVAEKNRALKLSQAELREKEILLQRRNLLIGALVLATLLLLSLGLALRSRYRYKQQQELIATELRLQQNQIKAVIVAQEAEKTRFAQDLHDGMGQLLTALKLSLGAPGAENGKSQQLVEELYRELRHLAYNIMPQTLVKKGLPDALAELSERLNAAQTQIKLYSRAHGMSSRLPLQAEQLLYRVVQEWLTNVMKYAQATECTINLVADDESLSLMIEDDGKGFDSEELARSKGHGWANIKSRLSLLGAQFYVDSRAGRKGSSLVIELSLAGIKP